MKTLNNNKNSRKIVLGGLFALALLPLLGAFVHHAPVRAAKPAAVQIADGSETHGGKPPKGA